MSRLASASLGQPSWSNSLVTHGSQPARPRSRHAVSLSSVTVMHVTASLRALIAALAMRSVASLCAPGHMRSVKSFGHACSRQTPHAWPCTLVMSLNHAHGCQLAHARSRTLAILGCLIPWFIFGLFGHPYRGMPCLCRAPILAVTVRMFWIFSMILFCLALV